MNGAPVASGPAAPRLSVVLAVLNERRNLPELLERISSLPLPSLEILVVDDGSRDGTREFVRDVARRDPRLRLLQHEGKQTTLRAQCQGIQAARGAYVLVMDSDLQHPPELLPDMVRRLESGAAVVVASRYAPGGSAGPRSVARWTYSRGAELLAKLLLRPARRVRDPVSGYFGFRRAIWVAPNPLYRGYKLGLFVLAMADGRPVTEVGFRFVGRTEGASKVTQDFRFIWVFAIEVLLARRFWRSVRRTAPRAPLDPVATGAPIDPP